MRRISPGVAAGVALALAAGVGGSCARKQKEDPRARLIRNLQTVLLLSEKAAERTQAAKELGDTGDERAVAPLGKALHDKVPTVRTAAATAMVRFGGSAVEPMLSALSAKEAGTRETAAAGLARLRTTSPTPQLVTQLEQKAVPALAAALDANDISVRVAAAEALGSFATPESIQALAGALEDAEAGVRESATMALGRLADERAAEEVIKLLRRSLNDTGVAPAPKRGPGGKAKGGGGGRGKGPVKTEDRRTIMLHAARKALLNLGQAAVGPLGKALAGQDAKLAAAAAELLGEIGEASAVPALTGQLKDTSARAVALHAGVVDALARIDANSARPEIMGALEAGMASPNAAARDDAIVYLAARKQKQIVPKVIALVRDRKGNAVLCVKALGQVGDPAAVEVLLDVLRNTDNYVKRGEAGKGRDIIGWEGLKAAAATSLAQIGDQRATEPVLAELRARMEEITKSGGRKTSSGAKQYDMSWQMREVLAKLCRALAALKCTKAVPDIVAVATLPAGWPPTHNTGAMSSLAELGDPAGLDGIIPNLAHFDPSTRVHACENLCRFRTARAAATLVAFMKDRYVKADLVKLQQTCAVGLADMGSPAVEPLLGALGDEMATFRAGVIHILARIGEPALEPLAKRLDDPNATVRQAAAWALGSDQWTGPAKPKRDEVALAALPAKAKDPVPAVRQAALWAMGKVGKPETFDVVAAGLKDDNGGVRRAAIEALGQLGEKRAVELVAPFLGDGDQGARQKAAQALARIGDPEAMGPLARSINDETTSLNELLERLIKEGKLLKGGRQNPRNRLTAEESRQIGLHRDARDFMRSAIEEIQTKSGRKAPPLVEVMKL